MSANPLDPDNPVTALVIEGIQAEGRGSPDVARDLYRRAWETRTDDLDGAVAAHYVARQQDMPQQALEWNRRALELAQRSGSELTAGWMPSLHLNLGRSYEDLGDHGRAIAHYRLAEAASSVLPDNGYGAMVRSGIARGIGRLTGTGADPSTSSTGR